MSMLMRLTKFLKIIPIILLVFTASCQKEVFTESDSSGADKGIIYVNTNPKGAKIYVDGKYSGYNTPDTLKWLSDSLHLITLKFSLIKDTSVRLRPQADVVKSIYVDYFASPSNYGGIKCESNPSNSLIYLNDASTSKNTPAYLSYLFPGSYEVKMSSPGFRSDSSNVIVYGGYDSYIKLTLQDTTSWIDYRINNSAIPSNKVVAVKADKNNNIWVGTLDYGIAKFSKNKFTHYTTSNSGLPYDFITCLDVDINNNLWVGTISGLARFNGTSWKTFDQQGSKIPANYITSIYCAPDGVTYVGTQKGLTKIVNDVPANYSSQTSPLLQNYISSITGTADGKLWVASVGGISYYSAGAWHTYTRQSSGLDGFDAGYLTVDKTGRVWCSFPENLKIGIMGGLMRFDGSNWREFSVPQIPKGKIQNLYCDTRGYVWVSSAIGILLVKPDDAQTLFKDTAYAMTTFDARCVTVDINNNAWFALFGGGIVKCKIIL